MEKFIIPREFTHLLLESINLIITLIGFTGFALEGGLTRCEELLSP